MANWLKINDIAEDLGVTYGAVRYWIKTGRLRAYRNENGYIFVKPGDYKRFVEEMEEKEGLNPIEEE